MADNAQRWLAGRIMWALVLAVEVVFLVQVLFSEQRWESLLAMVAVNVFLLPAVGILFAILFLVHRARRN